MMYELTDQWQRLETREIRGQIQPGRELQLEAREDSDGTVIVRLVVKRKSDVTGNPIITTSIPQ